MLKKANVPDRTENIIRTDRLEAFSDGVLAVIITIMAFQLKPPQGRLLTDIIPLIPILLAYTLSFVFIGIYWNNHHLLFRATKHISGGVMWANLHLLFWLSLIPFVTAWAGEHYDSPWPAVCYGTIGLFSVAAYYVLTRVIIRVNSATKIKEALNKDAKGIVSVMLYAVGVGVAFIHPVVSYFVYAAVSVMWFIPDRRLGKLKT